MMITASMNNIVRKKTSILFISTVLIMNSLFWANSAKCAELVDRIVAVVNNDIIALSELNKMIEPYTARIKSMGYTLEQQREMLYKVREDLLDQLINQKLTDQEVERLKVSVSEKEIDNSIERVKEANYYTDEELREALKKEGLSMEEYRDNVKNQILRSKLVNIAIKSKIIITSKDVEEYYHQHPELYGGDQKYHLWHIMIPISSFTGKSGRLELKKEMEGIYQKLEAGESFTSLAKTCSEWSKATGRELGLFEVKALSPQIQEAIKDLRPGEYTSVLETDQGFQIFFVQEIQESVGKPIKEVSAEIENKLFNAIIEEKYNAWLKDLRETSYIKILK